MYQRLGAAGLVHADGRNAAPSGIEGLTFAAAVCERVHVYGFHTDVPRGVKVGGVGLGGEVGSEHGSFVAPSYASIARDE